ncbi:MAG: hypothetical protein GX663_09060 [Clostridiales bacterium]|nr:hypothetical protein [Clostridiales bacterium]
MKNKIIEILDLYKIEKHKSEKIFSTLLSAFAEYPKLLNTFPDKEERLKAMEITVRF